MTVNSLLKGRLEEFGTAIRSPPWAVNVDTDDNPKGTHAAVKDDKHRWRLWINWTCGHRHLPSTAARHSNRNQAFSQEEKWPTS